MLVALESRKTIEPFFVKFKKDFIHGNLILDSKSQGTPEVLFIHGCNPVENSNDFLILRQMLAEKYGISSCAFDFIGHGSTGGNWNESTVSQRTEQSIDIINACFDSQPLNIVASGLSAYTAIKLTKLFPVNNLILLAPTLCSYEAYNTRLGKDQDELIQLSYTWAMTDALSIIQFFEGGLSILGAGSASSTQREVSGQLYANSLRTRERQAVDIFGKYGLCPMEYASHNPAVINCILGVIVGFCSNANEALMKG